MPVTFKGTVNGTREFELAPDEADFLDVVPTGPDTYHLLQDRTACRIAILHRDFTGKQYTITVNNRTYRVVLQDDLDLQISRMGYQSNTARNAGRIEAPMPGLILSVQVKAGDPVKEGDTLLILEAMKMENAILAPADGVVATVSVQEGQAVEKKSLLVEFE